MDRREVPKIMSASEPLVDASRIEALGRAMPAAAFGRSVKAFRSSLEKRSAEIDSALAGERWDDALRIVHSIKGVSGNFGATRLAIAAAVLESRIVDGDHSAALSLIAEFRETARLTVLGLDDALARSVPDVG